MIRSSAARVLLICVALIAGVRAGDDWRHGHRHYGGRGGYRGGYGYGGCGYGGCGYGGYGRPVAGATTTTTVVTSSNAFAGGRKLAEVSPATRSIVSAFERKDTPALVNMLKEEAAADHLGPLTYAVGAVYRQNPGAATDTLAQVLVAASKQGLHQQVVKATMVALVTAGAGHDAYAGAYAAAYTRDPAIMAQTIAKLPPGACMLLGIEGGGQQ